MCTKTVNFIVCLFLLGPWVQLQGQATRVYVATLDQSSCTLVWGNADGKYQNTIGREAPGIGQVAIKFGDETINTSKSWYRFEGLVPDKTYDYQISANGTQIGAGRVRTWPRQAESLTFFVIGDWGNGSSAQIALAARMEQERKQLENSPSPVRFVLSTGDNIYGGGGADRDWDKRFFVPYAGTLSAIPFYAVLGNHDGNESESSWDLPAYMDNFFSPAGPMARWYHFRYAGFAEFFALDSTVNQHPGSTAPMYLPDGEQTKWLNDEVKQQASPWRIAFLHHPLFTAGPNHPAVLPKLRHWFETFRNNGFTAVFSGHEHNLQFSERNAATGGMLFTVSGAGGELRRSSVLKRMQESNIAAWAPRVHFLIVNLEKDMMTITPVGITPVAPIDAAGRQVQMPLKIPRRKP